MSVNVVVDPLLGNAIDKLEVIGKFNSASRFPQYLHKAILVGAKPVPDCLCGDCSNAFERRCEITASLFMIYPLHFKMRTLTPRLQEIGKFFERKTAAILVVL